MNIEIENDGKFEYLEDKKKIWSLINFCFW